MPPRRAQFTQNTSPLEALRAVAEGITQQSRRPNLYGYVPHPKQLEFHRSTAHLKLYIGGNRCLAKGTMVLMADGTEKAIEDIEIGDYVIARDGSKTKVLEVFNNGVKECNEYVVSRYQDKISVVCTPDHQFWSAIEKHGVLGNFSKYSVGKLVNSRGRHKIQRSQGTSLGGIHESRAYMLGLMLGDGYMANQPARLQFTCADSILINEIDEFVPTSQAIQYRLKNAKEWFNWFKELKLIGTRSGNKFIPKEVWSWDEESIADLCAGLIVTDGSFYCNSANEEFHVAFSSNSYSMISDFRRLMGIRLGIWGSTITYENRGTYSITYGTKEALNKIAELPIKGIKATRLRFFYTRNSFSSFMGVQKSKPLGEINTYDIMVEHDSHTFMLANGLITSNSGKSVGGIVEDIWWLNGNHPHRKVPPPPIRGRIVGVDFDHGVAQIIIPELKRWLPPSALINGSWEDSYTKGERLLTLANGSTVELMSYDQDTDKFSGTSRHFVHYDEEPPYHVYNECQTRLIDTDGSAWLTMTPVEGMSWIYDGIYLPGIKGDNPDIKVVTIDTAENPHISVEAMERIFSQLSESERQAREHGQFVQLGGLVYPNFAKNTHVIPFEVPSKQWRWYMSMDHGYQNPTAWLWHAVAPDGTIITFDEHYESELTVKQHAAIVIQKNNRYGKPVDTIIGDPAIAQHNGVSGTSIQTEYAIAGLYIALGNNDVATGVNQVSSYLKLNPATKRPFWQITANCVNLIREMERLRWKTWMSKKAQFENNPQDKIHKKDDHACDAARYFFSFMPDLTPEMLKETRQTPRDTQTERYDQMLAKMALGQTQWRPAENSEMASLEYD